jgi:hypothetical protein
MSDVSRTSLRILCKALPTVVIAAMAFIAINHAPVTESNRVIVSGVVAVLIVLNGWYGPRIGSEPARFQ